MRVYLGTSPRAIQKNGKLLTDLYEVIQELGYEQLSDFVVKIDPGKFYEKTRAELEKHHRQTVKQISKADIAVFEVSVNSLSTGFLINLALDMGKSVVLVSGEKNEPILFRSVDLDKLLYAVYKETDREGLKIMMERVLKRAAKQIDTRFNFFVSPKMANFLDWVAREKKIPRAVFLRRLIDKEMKKEKDFVG